MNAHLLAGILAGMQGGQAEPPVDHQIMVIGSRLRTWRGHVVRPRQGPLRCVTDRSTTDVEVDRIGCDALVTCMTPLRPRLDLMRDRTLDRTTRISMRDAIQRDLNTCVTQRRAELIEELVDRRYRAREAGRDDN